jgi:hypothetical protein
LGQGAAIEEEVENEDAPDQHALAATRAVVSVSEVIVPGRLSVRGRS